MNRTEMAKFAKELEKLCAKHGVQPARDCEYGRHELEDYTPGLADELLEEFDAAEVARIEYEEERKEQAIRHAKCAAAGHNFTAWKLLSNTSIGPAEFRHCKTCGRQESRPFEGW